MGRGGRPRGGRAARGLGGRAGPWAVAEAFAPSGPSVPKSAFLPVGGKLPGMGAKVGVVARGPGPPLQPPLIHRPCLLLGGRALEFQWLRIY